MERKPEIEQALTLLRQQLSPNAYDSVEQIIDSDLTAIVLTSETEVNSAGYWWNVIQSDGRSEIHCKFRPDQLEKAGITAIGHKYHVSESDRLVTTEHVSADVLGALIKHGQILDLSDALDIVGKPLIKGYPTAFGLAFHKPQQGMETTFQYLCFAHKSKVPDGRGSHVGFRWIFSLPFERSKELIALLEQDPSLIETLFMHRYGERLVLPEDGLQRVRVNNLVVIGNVPREFRLQDPKAKIEFVSSNQHSFDIRLGEIAL